MTTENKQLLLSWDDCKWRLGKLWIIVAAVFFGFVLVLSLTGRFDVRNEELAKAFPKPVEAVVKWALSAILPSISLIIGALLSNLGAPPRQDAQVVQVVEARQFRLAYGVSVFYLAILFVILLASLSVNKLPVEILDSSSIWLSPLQGISGTILSVFYVRAALASPPSAGSSK